VKKLQDILAQQTFSKNDLVRLLEVSGNDRKLLFEAAAARKVEIVGKKVFFRGLVEFSNICSKDCLYCGIRKSNEKVIRYGAGNAEIIEACRFAWENRFGSVVLQSGELSSPAFVDRVEHLLKGI